MTSVYTPSKPEPQDPLWPIPRHNVTSRLTGSADPRAGSERNRDVVEAAIRRVPSKLDFCVRLEHVVGHPADDLLESDAELKTGEVRAEAAMDASPEPEVPVGLPVEDAAVRFVELAWVTVRGPVVHHDRLPRAERLTVDLHLLPRPAVGGRGPNLRSARTPPPQRG